MAIYRLQRGYFFEGDPPGKIIDLVTTAAIRHVLRNFPGLHQLLPSRRYFEVASTRTAVREDGVDLNGNGAMHDPLTFVDFVRWLDNEFPDSRPGSETDGFHTRQQDDWRSDTRAVKYLHIVGEQSQPNTTGEVVVQSRIVSDGYDAKEILVLRRNQVDGDETVPFDSAYRTPEYWAPDTEAFVYVGQGDGREKEANHLKMLEPVSRSSAATAALVAEGAQINRSPITRG